MKVSDVDENEKVSANGKTGSRTVRLIASSPILAMSHSVRICRHSISLLGTISSPNLLVIIPMNCLGLTIPITT